VPAHSTAGVDPGMLAFYERLLALSPPESHAWPLPKQRSEWNALCRQFRGPAPAGIVSTDLVIRGDADIQVRLHRPANAGAVPAAVYFHGGGWVLGGIDTHDDMCAEMAAGAGVAVAVVDYRLAPENPHPAQLRDSLAVLSTLRARAADHGIDASRIIAAGDSAGGQMSAGLALWLRDKGLPQLQGMVLIYPVLGADIDTPSYIRNAEAPCLTREEMAFYLDAFLGRSGSPAWTDPYAVPLSAVSLAGLPPAYITVAAHDPLRDDGVMFHDRLKAEGVTSFLREEPALAHSYMRARNHSAACRAGFDAIVGAVRSLAHDGRLPE
jgi:acetyl esterase